MAHSRTHAPARQIWPPVQMVPQAPQLVFEVWRSTQSSLHRVWPMAQVAAQTPALHTLLGGQAMPQRPQLSRSVCTLAQRLPQAIVPLGQSARRHRPAWQEKPCEQVARQAPQLALSFCRSTQRSWQADCPSGQPGAADAGHAELARPAGAVAPPAVQPVVGQVGAERAGPAGQVAAGRARRAADRAGPIDAEGARRAGRAADAAVLLAGLQVDALSAADGLVVAAGREAPPRDAALTRAADRAAGAAVASIRGDVRAGRAARHLRRIAVQPPVLRRTAHQGTQSDPCGKEPPPTKHHMNLQFGRGSLAPAPRPGQSRVGRRGICVTCHASEALPRGLVACACCAP
jgi:hypothetical protein